MKDQRDYEALETRQLVWLLVACGLLIGAIVAGEYALNERSTAAAIIAACGLAGALWISRKNIAYLIEDAILALREWKSRRRFN